MTDRRAERPSLAAIAANSSTGLGFFERETKDRPDLIIEVIWTSGGIDKLAIYRRLGIDEVWFWLAGRIEVHLLRGHSYERVARSRSLPALDLDLICTFLDRRSAHVARRDFREALRHAPQDRLP